MDIDNGQEFEDATTIPEILNHIMKELDINIPEEDKEKFHDCIELRYNQKDKDGQKNILIDKSEDITDILDTISCGFKGMLVNVSFKNCVRLNFFNKNNGANESLVWTWGEEIKPSMKIEELIQKINLKDLGMEN